MSERQVEPEANTEASAESLAAAPLAPSDPAPEVPASDLGAPEVEAVTEMPEDRVVRPGGHRAHPLVRKTGYGVILALTAAVLAASAVGYRELWRQEQVAKAKAAERELCAPAPLWNKNLPAVWSSAQAPQAEASYMANAAKDNPSYIRGADGHYFFSDLYSNNFSQAVGRQPLTDAQLKAWNDYFTDMQSRLQAEGAALVIQVSPAKWDVYPYHLPDWAKPLRSIGNLDRLLAAYPDLPVVDPRGNLESAPHPTYSGLNSHWTPYGAALAWQQFADCLQRRDGRFADLPRPQISSVRSEMPPSEYGPMGVSEQGDDWTVPVLAQPLTPVQLEDNSGARQVPGEHQVDFSDLPATTTNPSAPPHTAVILRDSMGTALSPWWAQAFRETVQVRNGFDIGNRPDPVALAREHQAQLVIVQFAERYLGTPPR